MKPQWLRAGLEALRKGGVGAVRVERLAEDVGVTKGSFYWHFRDRRDLLDAMLDPIFQKTLGATFLNPAAYKSPAGGTCGRRSCG